MSSLAGVVPPGVVTGDNLMKLMEHARAGGYAIPAVNVSSSSTANACLEAAKKANSPIIIQVSQGGGAFIGGKSLSDDKKTLPISASGAVAIALHIRAVAPFYGVPVVIHSDHCAKKLLPWFDGMLEADEAYFAKFGEPLFSSHMLDLSEEPDEENIAICAKYFKRLAPMKCWLEMEIGITGGEEDGVNNENVDPEKLYTTPEQVWNVYEALSKIGPMFSIAAAFGNVHGVYKPGNVVLSPHKLGQHQAFAASKLGLGAGSKPIFLVMHGGSGSTDDEIALAVKNGVVKMNIDTDTQWAYWDGMRGYEAKNHDYLQGQLGNPQGPAKPNKKYYDPRAFIRACEVTMAARVEVAFEKLGTTGKLGDKYQTLAATETPKAYAFFNSAPSTSLPTFAVGAIVGAIVGAALAKSL